MLQDSIIVFTSDNGGPAAGFNDNAASNWPLRGVIVIQNYILMVGTTWCPIIKEYRFNIPWTMIFKFKVAFKM